MNCIYIYNIDIYNRNKKFNRMEESFRTLLYEWYKGITSKIQNINQTLENYIDDNIVNKNEIQSFLLNLDPSLLDLDTPIEYDIYIINRTLTNFITSSKVVFRNTKDSIPPSLLSNGEKAFQICLLLLAMRQDLNSPFCIIDEINQGMDDNLEFIFYQMLFKDLSIQKSQYLLFTPHYNKQFHDFLSSSKYNNNICLYNSVNEIVKVTTHHLLIGEHIPTISI